MSICDGCMHNKVCGAEGVFDEGLTYCRDFLGWIPVSKKLPEEHEWMGTKRFGTTISDEVYVTLETPDGERFTKHLSFQNGGLSQADQERMNVWFKGAVPIAWMPLPSTYNIESEEINDKRRKRTMYL